MRSLLLAFLVGSAVACGASESEPEWKFGVTEIDSALVGTWTGTWTAAGKSGSIQLVLARSAPTATPKCGSRTLSAEGELSPKCIDSTSVNLVGTLTTSDDAFKATPMTGTLMVFGATFGNGDINLRTTDGKTLSVRYGDSTLQDGRVTLAAGEATFTLRK